MSELAELRARLRGLELQLRLLEAELARLENARKEPPPPSFAALHGIWKGEGRFSFEEIQAAELKLPPDL
jgi:hypothetical protein